MAAGDTHFIPVHVSSLSQSFWRVPQAAVPAMLDCVLASSGLSPSSLFSSLINAFPVLTRDIAKLGSDPCNYLASFVGALCHLLKKVGASHGALQLFIRQCLIPLMKMGHLCGSEILNQTADSFFDVVIETNSWGVIEATLVPFFLRSVGFCIGMLQNDELAIYEWDSCTVFPGLNDRLNDAEMDEGTIEPLFGPFPLPVSSSILTSILDASLQSFRAVGTTSEILANGCCYAEKLAGKLLWDLCNITVRMLSQSLESRSCAIGSLLPYIFKAFVLHNSFGISVGGQTHVLSRKYFFTKIWMCCQKLFSQGSSERRDAYSVLSLYLSFFSSINGCEDADVSHGTIAFDVRVQKIFWDELKRGLVDKEGLVRKQSLHMLKMSLQINEGIKCYSGASEMMLHDKSLFPHGMTKRGLWADKEAKSLGVGKICSSVGSGLNDQQRWEAFLLLYEMLEEYGTHLVEAAWNHQINLLLTFCSPSDGSLKITSSGVYQNQMETFEGIFNWLTILWERGFCHDNPQVRCLIMQSFLDIEWKNHGGCEKLVPESFVLGPFIQGLNDPVHHKDFGVKGVYSSRTIEGATKFLCQYTGGLILKEGISFLANLASVAKQFSFGRAGLMSLAKCIASAACGVNAHKTIQATQCEDAFLDAIQKKSVSESFSCDDGAELLDILRFVIESSRQHFNPNYRFQVCENVLTAAASLVCTCGIPFEILLHFISALPREFTDCGGLLRAKVQKWLLRCGKENCSANSCSRMQILSSLYDFPKSFISCHYYAGACNTYDDDDLDAWRSSAQKWARVLFLVIEEKHQLEPLLMFLQNHGINISRQNNHLEWEPLKFLILILSLVQELHIMQERTTYSSVKESRTVTFLAEDFVLVEMFFKCFLSIMEDVISFATLSCSIFWSRTVREDTSLPSCVTGKLGGPSQRRLSSSTTTAVLQAITSMKAVASVSSWCAQFRSDDILNITFIFLWEFFLKVVASPPCKSETGAEICVAAYEALATVLKTLVSGFSLSSLDLIREKSKPLLPEVESKPLLDSSVFAFLQHINDLLAVGLLARTRQAILMNWKWLCLECLLSIPNYALENGVHLGSTIFYFSDAAVRYIFCDLVESLENAGEGSILPMLRSVRLILGLFASGKQGSIVSSSDGVDCQMMWQLVHSSWILHVSCNKRRVASIAALLSSVLHSSIFGDEVMHSIDNAPGPLKWFVEEILNEGTKSPRTIRLAALHLTGLWLLHPVTIKYYIKELKLLALHGSVAFDEDFEAELADNHDARAEVSLLAKSPEPELTEVFVNTELYARVSVAVLFYKLADLADLVGSISESKDCHAACESGKLFLLELLDSAVNDKDLAKELYKKYSAIHRRKVRAWQMLCVLSRFIDQEIVQKVSCTLHICLYRNNLPAVRQYLETFAIHIYLKFPSLVKEQLVSIFQDYNMKSQALSSYVYVAANVILHAPEKNQYRHLDELLPPIFPLLTSHHHSLRGFTQLLVYQVLCKLFPELDTSLSESMPIEKRCFVDLKLYLSKNSDCMRLRASMIGYLDAFDPKNSVTPTGIFANRIEELEFECVPTSLMEQVITFLNDVREDLRCSMAKDAITIKNESLRIAEDLRGLNKLENAHKEASFSKLFNNVLLDFQKKITLSKHEKQEMVSSSLGTRESYKPLLDMEKDDDLLEQLLHSRSTAMERIRASRQQFILVASLIDRIPNLAGLARTCEVFKAAGLTVADSSILHDKQFQLISVTAEKWVPIIEVPVNSVKLFLEKKKREGFSILGLEQTAKSIPLDQYTFQPKTVLVLGREKEGIPVDIIHILDACIEIPQLGVVRSLNVHVSGAIALWEYTRQQRSQ